MLPFLGYRSTAFVAALAATSPSPPSSRLSVSSRNKNERRYDEMIDALTLSPAAIECIDNPRSRVLFRGFDAGCRDERIRGAFRILYRDSAPIRVAGDLIFGQLAAAADQAARVHSGLLLTEDVAGTEDLEGGDALAATLAAWRRLFDLMDGDNSGGLGRDELLAAPELLKLVQPAFDDDKDDVGRDDSVLVEKFMELADENGDGVISFAEFANAAAGQPRSWLVEDALATIPYSAASSPSSVVHDTRQPKRREGFLGRKSPDERFDDMLRQCLEWEERLGWGPETDNNDGETTNEAHLTGCKVDATLEQQQPQISQHDNDDEDKRLMQVLKGTLVGARCGPVVDALRMCYLNYSPLRFGGDIIFKLLGRVVRTRLPPLKE